MKRTRNHYRISVPVKKLKADGTLEDTMTTPRIVNLYKMLCNCWDSDFCEAFLTCLETEECTEEELKEVFQIRDDEDSPGILYTLLFRSGSSDENSKNAAFDILRRLFDLDQNLIYAREMGGTLLESALRHGISEEAIEVLLIADESKKTLLMKMTGGDLPLHAAMLWEDISFATVKKLYVGKHAKQILDSRNTDGQTPIHFACCSNHPAFPILIQDRIQLTKGIPVWHQRLRELVAKYQEQHKQATEWMDEDDIDEDDIDEFRHYFMDLFNKSVSEFENELPEVLTLLELAVWKGRELPIDAKERRAKWITCGSRRIARGVAEFLGRDTVTQLQHEFDRIKKETDERYPSSDSDSDSDSLSDSEEEESSDDDEQDEEESSGE